MLIKLKIIDKGIGNQGISVVNAETGQELDNVFEVNYIADSKGSAVIIKVMNPQVELETGGLILEEGNG